MNSVHITQDTRLRGRRVLVVGLGLSGVSALRFLRRADAQVTVTDSRAAPAGIEALRAAFPDVSFQLGAFAAPEPLNQFDMAVVSPGVDLQEPFVQGLAAAGVPLIGDVELFARALAALPQRPKVIGITGSNGKSTVTTLVGEMARAAGWRVAVGGNLGTPALDLLAEDIELYVLELSSFQLETTRHLACDAAAYLNLSEDHLDRHGTMARYGAIKARIFEGAQVAVVNRDDAAVMEAAAQVPATTRMVSFGLDGADPGHFGVGMEGGELWLCRGSMPLLTQAQLRIAGLHNAANALAALALAGRPWPPLKACHIAAGWGANSTASATSTTARAPMSDRPWRRSADCRRRSTGWAAGRARGRTSRRWHPRCETAPVPPMSLARTPGVWPKPWRARFR